MLGAGLVISQNLFRRFFSTRWTPLSYPRETASACRPSVSKRMPLTCADVRRRSFRAFKHFGGVSDRRAVTVAPTTRSSPTMDFNLIFSCLEIDCLIARTCGTAVR